ncbi:MAG: hypothetical protein JST30_05945 [Armatimonadetes bacterium]|nr:hypothetical protein [Armatimonadota bacterium]
MEEIRRRDRAVFLKELFSFGKLVQILVGLLVSAGLVSLFHLGGTWLTLVALGMTSALVWSAWDASKTKRFVNSKFQLIWTACQERQRRFHHALGQLSKRGIADLQELPRTIEGVSQELYVALRRADIVAHEVANSEGWLVANPRIGQPMSPDRQAQELYRIADKNIAEYRQHYLNVMGGVERTEAQAAVFTTTLDTLRMKMLGYRLVGRDLEAPTHEFLAALTEARMQLDSIDKALDELELTPFPTTVTLVPDGPPPVPSHLKSIADPAEDRLEERF